MAFDIDRFVALSKAIDLSSIDWGDARRTGITDDEAQVLGHLQDIESHTILYLRDLLSGYTARDPAVTTFLACWVYEETCHGRALDRFLVEVGRPPASSRYEDVHARPSLRELFNGWASRAVASATPHAAAVHMAWGAANEFAAAMVYNGVARRTRNRQLEKLCQLIAKDERRHFAFYHDQAEKRLADGGRVAQGLCRFVMGRFWHPVGLTVGGPFATDVCVSYVFDGAFGRREAASFDEMMRGLPGMGGWGDVGERWARDACARYRSASPAAYDRHRALDP